MLNCNVEEDIGFGRKIAMLKETLDLKEKSPNKKSSLKIADKLKKSAKSAI